MSKVLPLLLLGSCLSAPALAADPHSILAANRIASGGAAWTGKSTLELKYDYSGQGLTGTSSSLQDLARGAFVDSYDIPPTVGANGYDGSHAWEKEPSGTVTNQSGGDVIPVAITESYFDRHLWWAPDYHGARVVNEGSKMVGGHSYDVLNVTPAGGTPIEAWFDPATHLLFRTVELNGGLTMTTTYSDYASVDGAMIARKQVLDDGSGDLQTYTLTSAKFSKPLPLGTYRKPAENLHDSSIAGGASETTVPFRLLNNHIYADVRVNGSEPMTFMFDTGGHTILTPGTAKRLGITPVGSTTAGGNGDNLVQTGQATVKSISVGGATVTNQPAFILQFMPPGTEGLKVDGMLGYEFLARFVTRFDYGRHTITFIDKKHFDRASAGTPVPTQLFHQDVEFLGSYDGIPARFFIDTGSRGALGLNKVWAAANGIPRPGTRTAEAQTGWGVGGPTRSLVFRDGALKLGDVTVAHPLSEVSTDKGGSLSKSVFPNNVGGGILKRFVVTIDYGHYTLFLKPVPGVVPDLDTFDRSGMWINAAPGGFKVISVTKGGPAESAGVKEGDLITAIDGRNVTEAELPTVRMKWRNQPSGTVVPLRIARGSNSREITLVLKNMI